MLALTLRFPLGMYYALGVRARDDASPRAEWPPSPVRIIGALLAAAHEVPGDDLEADRALIGRLAAASPPWLITRRVVAPHAQRDDEHAVAELRGPSRWAPRNPQSSELKALSPRVVGRTRTEVVKAGVAIGDHPVRVLWEVDLAEHDHRRLRRLVEQVAWIGTSRSPVLIGIDVPAAPGPRAVADVLAGEDDAMIWSPLPWDSFAADDHVRVPTRATVAEFDTAYETRRSARGRVENSGHLRPAHTGRLAPYEIRRPYAVPVETFDPQQWGTIITLALDRDRSELRPRTPATYLLARATRAALLSAFAERGEPGDAPALLTARDGEPHLAVVPLPFVGAERADGGIRGIALLLPHPARRSEVWNERTALDKGIVALIEGAGVRIPGAGHIWLRQPRAKADRLLALDPERYAGPAQTWVTVTPIHHSRRRTSNGPNGVWRQVVADCAHAGLPEPVRIEVLSRCAVEGGAERLASTGQAPPKWRDAVAGPCSHLRIEFAQPVRGPVLLGRARHFGVGLCVPEVNR